ncbi:MAG TPA: hypothetical protein PKW15_05160 [Alphaproteobacteria bacterium]|nr:hypothetical protein [Rhodospirillaceae bacterium]HRJ12614.1 hypothetical protein [Alphaproteobacteria bacterium]
MRNSTKVSEKFLNYLAPFGAAVVTFLLIVMLAACEGDHPVDGWLGKWTGPEGTYLMLTKKEKNYDVIIQSMDKIQTYQATRDASGLKFMRNNQTETIRRGNGKDTGMKWLLDKKDCLIVRSGEGYCRN